MLGLVPFTQTTCPAWLLLQLHEKELVIFAVNDNPDVEYAAGGSHW